MYACHRRGDRKLPLVRSSLQTPTLPHRSQSLELCQGRVSKAAGRSEGRRLRNLLAPRGSGALRDPVVVCSIAIKTGGSSAFYCQPEISNCHCELPAANLNWPTVKELAPPGIHSRAGPRTGLDLLRVWSEAAGMLKHEAVPFCAKKAFAPCR